MADIKDFFSEKLKRQQDNSIDYKERIRAHKLAVFIRNVALIVIFVVAVAVTNLSWKNKVFTGFNVLSSAPISVVTGATAKNLDGNLFIYSKDGASCIDSKGKAIWNESFQMQSPIVSINKGTVAIGDYNGRNIFVANKDKILGTVKTNLPIRDITVSQNGVVAAVLDDSEVIRVFVYDGNKDTDEPIVQAKATMSKSGYPLSVALSPNGKLMMVSYFYVDSGKMKSAVSFYNFGEVGSNKVDNFVSGFDYLNTVMPYVRFMDNDSAFGVANDRIVFFKGDEIPDNIGTGLQNEEIVGIYNNEEYVGLVFLNTTGESLYRLDIYSDEGKKINSLSIDMDFTDIVFNKDNVIIYGGSQCLISTVKGSVKYEGKVEGNINLLMPTGSAYKYTLITQDSIDSVELN